jgi:hypothetical protein
MRLTNLGKIVFTVLVTIIALAAIFFVSTTTSSYGSSTTPVLQATTSAPKVVTATIPKEFKKDRLKKPKPHTSCLDKLGILLHRVGFRGENLREAWSIAMRESNGKERTVSSTGDYGLFQFNYPTWGNTLDYSRILDGEYNAAQAFRISKGGRTWAHWGLTGSGQTDPSLYGSWSSGQVWAWITEPYQRYYRQYPC